MGPLCATLWEIDPIRKMLRQRHIELGGLIKKISKEIQQQSRGGWCLYRGNPLYFSFFFFSEDGRGGSPHLRHQQPHTHTHNKRHPRQEKQNIVYSMYILKRNTSLSISVTSNWQTSFFFGRRRWHPSLSILFFLFFAWAVQRPLLSFSSFFSCWFSSLKLF